MLALYKSLASTHNPQEADRLTREVEAVDKSIDGLVYELYGLTEEEIRIVESWPPSRPSPIRRSRMGEVTVPNLVKNKEGAMSAEFE